MVSTNRRGETGAMSDAKQRIVEALRGAVYPVDIDGAADELLVVVERLQRAAVAEALREAASEVMREHGTASLAAKILRARAIAVDALSVEVLPGDGHWSDCATHNEPALPNGPCNCGAQAGVKNCRCAELGADQREHIDGVCIPRYIVGS